MTARLKFIGAVREVTGSNHLLRTGESKVIIDCGLFQGRRQEFYERNSSFAFAPAEIDACILSHAHIDHSGNIPNLVKKGFDERIVTTDPTRDLCSAMLPDSGHIHESDAKYVSKLHKRKGLPPVEPIYTREEAEQSLQFFSGHPYDQRVNVTEDIFVTFYDAGHVLGSATPLIEIGSGENTVKIAYAVDLGRKDIPILNDPVRPPEIDWLIIESTYGGRVHDPIDTGKEKLADCISRTAKRGGKVIIPSFALERTQEIVYFLSQLRMEKRLPDIPVIIDSPLATRITEIFSHHPQVYDEEMYRSFNTGLDPLGTLNFEYITDVERSKELNDDDRPMVIISASGMCEAGRILHHLKNNIGDRKNTVLVVGYMASNTLGRKIVERESVVKIFGEEYELRAEVEILNSFSSHADCNDLLEYILPLKESVKGIFLVHGEEDQSRKLFKTLVAEGLPAHLPEPGEEVELS
jgi:metallo-beta-lactamase family protein